MYIHITHHCNAIVALYFIIEWYYPMRVLYELNHVISYAIYLIFNSFCLFKIFNLPPNSIMTQMFLTNRQK